MKSITACIGLASLLLVLPAQADVIFTDRNLFNAAVAGLSPILENWSSLPDGTILTTYNGITYTPGDPGDMAITTSAYACNGCTEGLGGTNLGFFDTAESMTFTFSAPSTIFGIDINTNATGPDYMLVTDGGSVAFSGLDPFPGLPTGEFIGLIATTPFTVATITADGTNTYTLDNLIYNIAPSTSTPEPSGVLLLLTAVAVGGFGIWHRRRRTAEGRLEPR